MHAFIYILFFHPLLIRQRIGLAQGFIVIRFFVYLNLLVLSENVE